MYIPLKKALNIPLVLKFTYTKSSLDTVNVLFKIRFFPCTCCGVELLNSPTAAVLHLISLSLSLGAYVVRLCG